MTTASSIECGYCKASNQRGATICVRCGKRLRGSNLDIFQWLFLVGSAAAVFFGFSAIDTGIGLFALAGILAVYARIAQASRHQKENQEWHGKVLDWLDSQEKD